MIKHSISKNNNEAQENYKTTFQTKIYAMNMWGYEKNHIDSGFQKNQEKKRRKKM